MRLRTQSSSPRRGPVLPTTTTTAAHQLNGNHRRGQGRRRNNNNPPFPASQQTVVISKSAIRTFGVLAILFLVGVHLYLIQILLARTTSSSATDQEDLVSPATLPPFRITPLRTVDREQYTIRINTFQRLEQLNVSIHHHLTCGDAVAQIQVVWCLEQGEPPAFLEEISPKVVVERHEVNSLNERFHILSNTPQPTLAILSIDDDVLRPCTAIDSGFFRWTTNPERMVGFDARTHVRHHKDSGKEVWAYGYLSTTEQTNQYSLTLPRYAFLHKDYLEYYSSHMPRSIYDKVAENFNCEDIAMSFLVTSLTSGAQPPLLADFWAVRSMIKLYTESKISATKSHKAIRDECVDEFASTLGLKGKLHHSKLKHSDNFEYGDRIAPVLSSPGIGGTQSRQEAFLKQLEIWKKIPTNDLVREWTVLKGMASRDAYVAGLLEGTDPWKQRWHGKHPQQPAEERDEDAHAAARGDLVLPHVEAPGHDHGR